MEGGDGAERVIKKNRKQIQEGTWGGTESWREKTANMRQERRNNTRTQREREEEENKEGDGGIKEWGTSWWDDLVSPETHARLKRQDGQSASVWNAEAKQSCVYACVCVRSCVYVCVCCPDPAGARRLYWRCNLHWSHRRAGTTMCLRSQKHTLRFVHTHARTLLLGDITPKRRPSWVSKQ